MWLNRKYCSGELDLLGCCANYEVSGKDGVAWKKSEPRVVFFQEHRMALPAIWGALHDGLFSGSIPTLVRIDAHTDIAEESIDYKDARPKIKTIEDCILFSNALDWDDGGWVEAAIKLGWVDDVICLYVQPTEWKFFSEPTVDIDGKLHNIYVYPDLADEPPDLGCGRVELALEPLEELVIGVNANGIQQSIWVDIDLDFAVKDVRRAEARALTAEELRQTLAKPVRCVPMPEPPIASTVISQLLERAMLITIASEPKFSCGFNGVAQILEGMRGIFPEHKRLFNWFERT